jgi:hypothetical protein
MARTAIQSNIRLQVLTEAGYRCAVPTCRNILAVDIHHLIEVSEGGGNEQGNLIALCPTCHALFHRGTIDRSSLYAYKLMLVSLSSAFDKNTIDDLLFLASPANSNLYVSGDGVLKFSRLVGAGLATFSLFMQNGPMVLYRVGLTQKGADLIQAWKSGDRKQVEAVL